MTDKKERANEYNKKWQKEHPEKCKEYAKKNYEKHREKILLQQKAYYNANKVAQAEYAKRYNLENKEKRAVWKNAYYQRNRELITEKRYGMNPGEYRILMDKQGGKCAICADERRNGAKYLVVDHNHETGKVRKLLCPSCNTAIGVLLESISYMEKLKVYLLEHEN